MLTSCLLGVLFLFYRFDKGKKILVGWLPTVFYSMIKMYIELELEFFY